MFRGILCPSILEEISTVFNAFSNENLGLFIFFSFFAKNIVKNYYTYIRDRRNKELILDDPKFGQKVLASEYIDNSKIEDCVQKVKRDYFGALKGLGSFN